MICDGLNQERTNMNLKIEPCLTLLGNIGDTRRARFRDSITLRSRVTPHS